MAHSITGIDLRAICTFYRSEIVVGRQPKKKPKLSSRKTFAGGKKKGRKKEKKKRGQGTRKSDW